MADRCVAEMMQRITANRVEAVIKDLRRTIRRGDNIIFDLRSDSLLEAITHEESEFRVTMYHPDLLKRTHSLGRHQYLIARDVIEADVVINVPKLTRKPASPAP